MNIIRCLLVVVATFWAGSAAYAASALVGAWILERSDNPLPDGTVVPYCTGVHGLIIYTAEGYVSVALNCAAIGSGNEPADVSGRKFLYAGTYRYDGANVVHTLTNASQPELIGQSFTRAVTITGDKLVLSGENQGQVFSAHWRHVARTVDTEFGQHDLDWSVPEESLVLTCDDSSVAGYDVVVDGRPLHDFSISIAYSATQDRALRTACGVLEREELRGQTRLRFQADEECEITFKRKSDGKVAKLTFADC